MALILLCLSTFLFAPYYGGSPIAALGFVLTCLFVAFAIASNERIGPSISWLGKRSYFVSFMHFFMLATLPSSPFETSVSAVLALPVVTLSVIAISYAPSELSYRYFESTMREKFRISEAQRFLRLDFSENMGVGRPDLKDRIQGESYCASIKLSQIFR